MQPGQVGDFASLEAAARYCEEQMLSRAIACGLVRPEHTVVMLEEVLAAHAAQVREGEGGRNGRDLRGGGKWKARRRGEGGNR